MDASPEQQLAPPHQLATSPEQQLRAYVDYLRDMGIYDLYRREELKTLLPEALRGRLALSAKIGVLAASSTAGRNPSAFSRSAAAPVGTATVSSRSAATTPNLGGLNARVPDSRTAEIASANRFTAPATAHISSPELAPAMSKPPSFDALAPLPTQIVPAEDRAAALDALRGTIGDCTRCPLAYAGRHTIVFGDGDPNARLMFVGEGPGADEDISGLPFVGKAGQLLNNMIAAMGLKREEVYIANIVKCRPPGNRTPEFVEATTCSQFLLRQIDIVRPEVIVALGATAATYLLGVRQSLASLRGRWHAARGAKVAVTYHPAFLLRDPRQKGEAWKDLQRVMAELGLAAPKR